MEACNVILADSELNDLEDDYWACHTLPTVTVTRVIAVAQLRALEWLQPHAEENHSQVTVTLDKTDWYDLCRIAGLQEKKKREDR